MHARRHAFTTHAPTRTFIEIVLAQCAVRNQAVETTHERIIDRLTPLNTHLNTARMVITFNPECTDENYTSDLIEMVVFSKQGDKTIQ
jgi:hypothetical protein